MVPAIQKKVTAFLMTFIGEKKGCALTGYTMAGLMKRKKRRSPIKLKVSVGVTFFLTAALHMVAVTSELERRR